MNPKIPVLAVRQPWAGLIESGIKTIEVRSYPAPQKYIGRKIAIYASKTKPVSRDIDYVNRLLVFKDKPSYIPGSCYTLGSIVALATLDSSTKHTKAADFLNWQLVHFAPFRYYKRIMYYWALKDIQPLADPIPFTFSGSMVWSSIEAAKVEEFLNKDN